MAAATSEEDVPPSVAESTSSSSLWWSKARRLSRRSQSSRLSTMSAKVLAAGLIASSAVAFSAMSAIMSAHSYRADYLEYLTLAVPRFWLPWLACASILLLGGENPWTGFFGRDTLVRTLLNLFAAALEAATLAQLQLVDATIIMFTHPFFAALLGVKLLGEEWSCMRSCLLVLAFLGVVIANAPWEHVQRERSPLLHSPGVACGVCYSVAVASMNIWTRARTPGTKALLLVHHYLFLGTLVSAGMLLFLAGWRSASLVQQQFAEHPDSALGVVAAVVAGELACTKGFQLADVGILSGLRNIDIVLVFVWQAVFLHQDISLWSASGAGLVAVSTTLLVMPWLLDYSHGRGGRSRPRAESHDSNMDSC